MIRRISLVGAGLAVLALPLAAAAQDSGDVLRAYVENLPCGEMDCSYTAEQQERLRRSEELQSLMTEFARDMADGSSTQGWEDGFEDRDGNIATLEHNLASLRSLTATANRIDQMWAELNDDSRGPAAMERLQGLIDTTTQMLTNEREIQAADRKADN